MRLSKRISIFLLVLVISGISPSQLFSDETSKSVGRVVTVNGSAKCKGKQMRVGDDVTSGDTIETLKESSVRLLLSDRSVVDIGPVTSFHVDQMSLKNVSDREVDAGVDFGQIRSYVSKKLNERGRFNIRTRTAVLAVRGTEFFVAHDPTNRRALDGVTVSEGKVWATNGKNAAILLPGQQWSNRFDSRADKNGSGAGAYTPQVFNLSKGELTKFVADRRVSDHTFSRAIIFRETGDKRPRGDQTGNSGIHHQNGNDSKDGKDKKGQGDDSAGGETLNALKKTMGDTVLATNAEAPVVDPKGFSVPGLRDNPAEVVKPVSGDPIFNPTVLIKVKFK